MFDTFCQWLQRKINPDNPSKKRRGCLACGCCCEHFGGYLHASAADLDRWKRLDRQDLLALVHHAGWIWVDPKIGRRGSPCPFLHRIESGEARCRIHEIKPDMCRDYPSLDHGRHCFRGIYIPKRSLQ